MDLNQYLDQLESQPKAPPPPPKTGAARMVGDLGVKAAQGVVDLGQSAVGVGSLLTGGVVGKGMRAIGYDPERTNAALGELLSPEQQAAERAVQEADGFGGTVAAALQNPRAIAGSVAESVPSMLGIGGLTRMVAQRIALKAAAPFGGLATAEGAAAAQQAVDAAATRLLLTSGVAEGAQSAGQIADGAQAAGRDYADYALPALASGVATAGITLGAGKLAGDATTALFSGSRTAGARGSLPTRIAKSAVSEGALQEMPQSAIEQVATNAAMGDPLGKGVGNQAAIGLLTGAAMGAGEGAVAPHQARAKAAADAVRVTETVPEVGPLSAAANMATEAKAQAIENAPPVETIPAEPVVDAIMERIKRMEGTDRTDAAHAYAVVQRDDVPKGVRQFNSKLLDKILAKYEDPAATPLDMPAEPSAVEAPDLTTTPGAAPDLQALDFQKDIPTGSLALVDPAEEERARAATVDFTPTDTTPNLETAPGAAAPRQGLEMQPAAPAAPEWSLFPKETGTLGIPRAEMPQIRSETHGPLVNFLNARGVTHESQEVDPSSLKPTQAEYSEPKVDKMADLKDSDRSVLVSADGHVLDGHHQWLAAGANDKPLRVIRLNSPMKDLLPLVREFPSAQTPTSEGTASSAPRAGGAEAAAVPAGSREAPRVQPGAGVTAGKGDEAQQRDGALSPAEVAKSESASPHSSQTAAAPSGKEVTKETTSSPDSSQAAAAEDGATQEEKVRTVVELRKQVAVLRSLRKCLGGA